MDRKNIFKLATYVRNLAFSNALFQEKSLELGIDTHTEPVFALDCLREEMPEEFKEMMEIARKSSVRDLVGEYLEKR